MLREWRPHWADRARTKKAVSTIFSLGEKDTPKSWEAPLLLNTDSYDWSAKYLQGSSIWIAGILESLVSGHTAR
jgi:hypothetical protein